MSELINSRLTEVHSVKERDKRKRPHIVANPDTFMEVQSCHLKKEKDEH